MTSRRMFLLILLCTFLSGCNVATESTNFPPPAPSDISFLGEWEGRRNQTAVECRVRFDENFVDIEFIGEPSSRTRDAYTATKIGNEITLNVENIPEPLTLVIHNDKLFFGLSEQGRMKEDVPRITTYNFRRPEPR